MANISRSEYAKAKAALEKSYTSDSIKAYTDAYNQAKSTWSTTKDAVNSASGLLVKNSSGSNSGGTNSVTSGWTSSGWVSGNSTSWWDVYGDKSWNVTATWPMDFSKYTWPATLKESNNVAFWENAKKREQATPWFLTDRNNTIAYEIYNNRKNNWNLTDVEEYLMQYDDYKNSSQKERDNTKNAITLRLWEIEKANWDTTITDTTKITDANGDWDKITSKLKDYNWDGVEDKPWYYYNNWEYYRAYGYDSWSKELQDEFDRLPDNKKKEVSNYWAEALQEYLKLWTDYKRTTEYLDKKHDIDTDLYKNSKRQAEIQMGQTLRHAEESFNNLKQNWQYLGNMWMPWISATRMEAIWDAIQEAKTTLAEIEELEDLKMDAMVNQWKEQELAYAKQIDDLTYNLTWQTSQEFVDALSKFTAAELEWNLDTIDWITAFRRELLDEMDKNLSWITSASLQQMQYITQQYQDVADKMYEYAQNANTVNKDMSAVKWYYVDGNGNPIFNAKGETIEVPQSAPMDPIYDKETGKLITFAYDENWQIVAQVQDILGWGSWGTQATIVSLLEQWASVQDILKMYPNVDLKTVQALAEVVQPVNWWIKYSDYTWKGWNYKSVNDITLRAWLQNFVKKWVDENNNLKKWMHWWQCGEFVNNYLENMWVGRLFTDPITEKEKNINSDTPKVWSVVIMNSESQPQYWHVGIVTGYDEKTGTIKILQSNKKGEEEVFVSTKNKDDKNILWYFDPTKSIDTYNNEVKSAVYEAQGLNSKGFRDNDTANYNNYLKKWDSAFTNADKERIAKSYGSYEAFQDAATAYQQNLDNQVSDVSIDLLKTLYKIKKMDSTDYWMAKNEPEWAMQRWIGTWWDWRTEIDHVIANTTLEKLVNMKSQWATFGALSEWELDMLNSSANKLNYTSSYKKFMENVDDMIAGIEGSMDMRGYDYSKLKNEWWTTTTTTNNGPKPWGNVT